MLDPVGFWSYARLDDEHSDGQLSQLRAIVGKAIGIQYGDTVTLWQDIQAIPYGVDWLAEIETTIGKTTFFIPLVTPRFLKSKFCRDEFVSYRRRMQALGRDDLIFPVHYVDVDGVRPEDTLFGDELAALRRAHWIDYRPLFYADPKSEEVRRWAGGFARGILQAMRREAAHSGEAPVASEPPSAAVAKLEAPSRPPAAVVKETPPVAKEATPPSPPAPDAQAAAPVVKETTQPPSAPASPPIAPRSSPRIGTRATWIAGALAIVALVAVGIATLKRSDKGENAVSANPSADVSLSKAPERNATPEPKPERVDQATPEASPSAVALTAQTPVSLTAPAPVNLLPGPSPSDACGAGLGSRAIGVLTAAEECALKPKDAFKECDDCPEMVVVPAGDFVMGSPDTETGHFPQEGPQHKVKFAKPFAAGKFAVTLGEFKAFVVATNFDVGLTCDSWNGSAWERREGGSWRNPGFLQIDEQPVVCVNWVEAEAYAKWLSDTTGKSYRLLSEAEWEYAARGGTTTAYYWGDAFLKGRAHCQGCGGEHDGTRTSPVGSFVPNAFGLYDMAGNAWQFTLDCYHKTYQVSDNDTAPSDGGAWTSGDCKFRVARGGSWMNAPAVLRSASRTGPAPSLRSNNLGFRVARTLTP
jgi:formylglycine-generating enzyme required for sulfatase activity